MTDQSNTSHPTTAAPVPATPAAEAPPAAPAVEVGEDLAPESAGNPPQPQDNRDDAPAVSGDGVPGDPSADADEHAAAAEAADVAGAGVADGGGVRGDVSADAGEQTVPAEAAEVADGVGVLGDDEDHLPAGQTVLAVGDEVVVDDDTMRRALEAILMVTDEPLPVLTLARAVGRNTGDIAEALVGLAAEYTEQGRGFDLREVGGGWRYYTRPEAAQYVERFVLDGQQARLTQAALETLAVVAYKQPVSRARVSAIRGVNVDGVMRTLVARGLVEEAGADTESQATLYRTTTYFLERMGMQSLDDLPELAPYLPEMDDIEEELAAQSLPPAEGEPEQPSTNTTTQDAEETDEAEDAESAEDAAEVGESTESAQATGEQVVAGGGWSDGGVLGADGSAEDVDEFGEPVGEDQVSSGDGSDQPAAAVDADDTDHARDEGDAVAAGHGDHADEADRVDEADHADDAGRVDEADRAGDVDRLDEADGGVRYGG